MKTSAGRQMKRKSYHFEAGQLVNFIRDHYTHYCLSLIFILRFIIVKWKSECKFLLIKHSYLSYALTLLVKDFKNPCLSKVSIWMATWLLDSIKEWFF